MIPAHGDGVVSGFVRRESGRDTEASGPIVKMQFTTQKASAPGPGGEAWFSLIRGGPIYLFLRRIGLAAPGWRGAALLCAVLVAVCFLPLVILSAMDSTLLARQAGMPLAGDVATLCRFLIALPALVLIAPDSDALSRQALAHFLDAGLVQAEGRQAFMQIVKGVLRLRDTVWPELLLVVVAFLPALLPPGTGPLVGTVAGWSFDADYSLTPAGMWLQFVAKPIWLLVALLWIWRLVLWALLLRRITRLDLALHAAHPDGAGGLGFLPALQQRLSKFSFAGGVVIAGAMANEIIYAGATVESIRGPLIAYIIIATLLLCLPLFVLAPRLALLKRQGLFAYGALGDAYLRAFEAKWLHPARRPATESEALGEMGGEYGTLTDLNQAYAVVQNLSIVPVNRYVLAGIALPAVLPMVPVVLLALGVQELITRLFSLLG